MSAGGGRGHLVARFDGRRKMQIQELKCQILLGLYGDNGKENGNYYNGSYRV